MKRSFIFLFVLLAFSITDIRAQTLTKEAQNSFALYNNTQDTKQLEKARKQIDDIYKTTKDSLSNRTNLLRGLVYSALAQVDTNRSFSYKKDPILEAKFSLNQIKSSKFRSAHELEFAYIKNHLAKAYLTNANQALSYNNFAEALKSFTSADSLAPGNMSITHNLALLNEKSGNLSKAIEYYELLIITRNQPQYFMTLANLYENVGQHEKMLTILQSGINKYPSNNDLLYKALNSLAEKKDYKAIINLIKEPFKIDESNTDLNYLAGFSFEMMGEDKKASEYYQRVLSIDPDNFDGNYALGLFYLNSYLHKAEEMDLVNKAKHYLSKSNEIDPNEIKTLRSLSILYSYIGDKAQLQKVNNKINQLK